MFVTVKDAMKVLIERRKFGFGDLTIGDREYPLAALTRITRHVLGKCLDHQRASRS